VSDGMQPPLDPDYTSLWMKMEKTSSVEAKVGRVNAMVMRLFVDSD